MEQDTKNIDNRRLSVLSVAPSEMSESRSQRPELQNEPKIDARRLSVQPSEAREVSVRDSRSQRPMVGDGNRRESMLSVNLQEDVEAEFQKVKNRAEKTKRQSIFDPTEEGIDGLRQVSVVVSTDDFGELPEPRVSIMISNDDFSKNVDLAKDVNQARKSSLAPSITISNEDFVSNTADRPSIMVSVMGSDEDGNFAEVSEEDEGNLNLRKSSSESSLRSNCSRDSRVSNFSRVSCLSNMSRISRMSNAGLTSTDNCGGTGGLPSLNFNLKLAQAQELKRSGSVVSTADKKELLAKRRNSRRKSSCSSVSRSSVNSIVRYKRNQQKRHEKIGTGKFKKESQITLLNYDENAVNNENNDEDVVSNKSRKSIISRISNLVGNIGNKVSRMSLADEMNHREHRPGEDTYRRNTEEFIAAEMARFKLEQENWKNYNFILGVGLFIMIGLIWTGHKYAKFAWVFLFGIVFGLIINNIPKFAGKVQDKRMRRASRRITTARQSVIGGNARRSVSGRNSVVSSNGRRRYSRAKGRTGKRNSVMLANV